MSTRESIEIEGVRLHEQPFPAAVRKGDMVFSSAVPGMDVQTKRVPDDPQAQIRNAFDNVVTLIENAGGTLEDVVKVQVFLQDRDMRPMVNEIWERLFPDEHSRPVRHTIGGPLPNNYVIQIEFVAFLG
jgi:enamine deaminase RidA (YjgF/YER057c/UK114 family)